MWVYKTLKCEVKHVRWATQQRQTKTTRICGFLSQKLRICVGAWTRKSSTNSVNALNFFLHLHSTFYVFYTAGDGHIKSNMTDVQDVKVNILFEQLVRL